MWVGLEFGANGVVSSKLKAVLEAKILVAEQQEDGHRLKNEEVGLYEILIECTFSFHLPFRQLQ